MEHMNWSNFKGNIWKSKIDVEGFIAENYTEYLGDDSFLEGISLKRKFL